jgi:hypothetical protein
MAQANTLEPLTAALGLPSEEHAAVARLEATRRRRRAHPWAIGPEYYQAPWHVYWRQVALSTRTQFPWASLRKSASS